VKLQQLTKCRGPKSKELQGKDYDQRLARLVGTYSKEEQKGMKVTHSAATPSTVTKATVILYKVST